jgi:predicted nucleotidyltransferase
MSTLSAYGAARDELLDRLLQLLKGDPRVVAAWLAGSLGRGEGDAWADCDVSIVVDDASLSALLGDRSRLYESLGEVLLLQDEIPGQPDVGDSFNLLHFGSPYGPIELDLSFIPFSRPKTSRLRALA